jgi:Sec-independent protein secretion pathway component TatC
MKLSADMRGLATGVLLVAPLLAALLTPSTDAFTMIVLWLVLAVLFVGGYLGLKWYMRKRP